MTTLTDLPQERRLPVAEFVALLAMMFAMTAFSIDAMLPAMPEIAAELTSDAPNRAQLIITSFVLGMGVGTFVTGPLSDAYGRRIVIVSGAILYSFGAMLAWAAPTLELVLAARFLQGLGVAGPRIAGMALVRDLYTGRAMARLISFVMMIFTLVPAVAPLIGSFIIAGFGWRAIFVAFVLFAAVAMSWFVMRQAETLAPEARLPLNPRSLLSAAREVLTHRVVMLVTFAQALSFASLFATLSSTQQVFDQSFGKADSFPIWFAVIALFAGTASILNARLVVRIGMRGMVTATFTAQVVNSAVMVFLFWTGWMPDALAFPAYLFWTITVFGMAGLTLGNLNALALEPMGHIAGTAASIVAAIATVLSVPIAVPFGLAFDGTPVPLMTGVLIFCLIALPLMRAVPPPDVIR
ncbi:Bicyclomycin resistance protein [Defluviimonas aquaemixtae]|uniref:Bicyclomycin resistance protein n=1 Tax=Albidovulum aquaemixtae TaxID=1542388 RepID=A0A2R8B5E6_9RHOB|nr:multidrug effflux MFS transporter [Defluviimonas aquaemixtae]SPH17807.1 Bicyclomycin resistance protein [Defluviimonas aquaemixtae]